MERTAYGTPGNKGPIDVLHFLRQLCESETDADIQFIVKGEKIPGHSLILQGRSHVLDAKFQHSNAEKTSSGTGIRIVVVDDVEPAVFRQLLLYLYTGQAPAVEEDDMTEPLFVAADKYAVYSLVDWCTTIICKKLHVGNMLHFLVLADRHSTVLLREACIHFIAENKHAVYANPEEFKQFNKLYPDLFFELTQCFALLHCTECCWH
jgi:speckle-type POZ protein